MQYKTENHEIAGVNHYADQIMHDLAAPNKEFNITAKEFKKKYKSGDRIYEYTFNTSNPRIIPEPDNPYDPNALRVMVGNTKIGYIKKGSCSRVKNTLNNPKDPVQDDVNVDPASAPDLDPVNVLAWSIKLLVLVSQSSQEL